MVYGCFPDSQGWSSPSMQMKAGPPGFSKVALVKNRWHQVFVFCGSKWSSFWSQYFWISDGSERSSVVSFSCSSSHNLWTVSWCLCHAMAVPTIRKLQSHRMPLTEAVMEARFGLFLTSFAGLWATSLHQQHLAMGIKAPIGDLGVDRLGMLGIHSIPDLGKVWTERRATRKASTSLFSKSSSCRWQTASTCWSEIQRELSFNVLYEQIDNQINNIW